MRIIFLQLYETKAKVYYGSLCIFHTLTRNITKKGENNPIKFTYTWQMKNGLNYIKYNQLAEENQDKKKKKKSFQK